MKLSVSYPIQASVWANLWYRLRRLWRELKCHHTHTFHASVPNAVWHWSEDERGPHYGIAIRGCYQCGRVECFNSQA
jgi:hypothetical protein